jgi:enolase-phosphatase E1
MWLAGESIRGILLDVEGTTTHVDFVYETLFPCARQNALNFLRQHWISAEVQTDIRGLREQHALDQSQGLQPPPLKLDSPEAELASTLDYLNWLMDRDSKATPLKSLQGKIWEEGYRAGTLKAHVFPDVPKALQRWSRQSKVISIFSSGSVLAQKQLFAHTIAGDLTGYIRHYFDTTTGPKRDPESYRRIASAIGLESSTIVFLSDVKEELDAAQSAGMRTMLCLRPGNRPQPAGAPHATICTFDDLLP